MKAAIYFFITVLFILSQSCNKLVQVPNPINTITTSQTFGNDDNATAAILGIYGYMSWNYNSLSFSNGATTIYAGQSSDELKSFGAASPFQTNTLLANNNLVKGYFWKPTYYAIDMANAAIEGLQASSSVSKSVKDQLTGEAKFLRAFSYFYLTNFFGDVPLILTSDWNKTALLPRTPQKEVYNQIVKDLQDAQSLLPSDYAIATERTRANKWAATALLARVYLYTEDWTNAELQATSVINNSSAFYLEMDLKNVFSKTSNETLLQLQVADASPRATFEGQQFIAPTVTSSPRYYITPQLKQSFEDPDNRKGAWLDSTKFGGTVYYYPHKYTVRQQLTPGIIPEYYVLLRLAEQYLIRAEARAHQQGKISDAINDLNIIRERAAANPLSTSLDQSQALIAVAQERRIELFAEWGHRWFDLNRTGLADSTLSAIKPQWKTTAKLYPIPESELSIDNNLKQNPGYF